MSPSPTNNNNNNNNNALNFWRLSIGSIIRCMRRLEEVLRQMCSAAKAIGNTELENKFSQGKACV